MHAFAQEDEAQGIDEGVLWRAAAIQILRPQILAAFRWIPACIHTGVDSGMPEKR